MQRKVKVLMIIGILLIVSGFVCIIVLQNKDTKEKPNQTEELEKVEDDDKLVENYREIGDTNITTEKNFAQLKYTENHLSSTRDNFATFTSVVYNESTRDIDHGHIEIEFTDKLGKILGTMDVVIHQLKVGESTVIFGSLENDLTKAYDFNVKFVE